MPATAKAERTEPTPAAEGSAHILATAKGGGFLAAGTVFEYAVRFLIGIVLARGLGATDYGLYVLAISASSLFAGISLLGTDDAMVRYVAIRVGRDDPDGVAGTLQIGLGVAVAGGLVMGLVLFLLAEPIATGLFERPEFAVVLRFFAFVVPFLSLSNTLLGMARGFKRMDAAAISQNGVQSVVRLVLMVLLAVTGTLSLYPASIAFGVADIAASLALIHFLNREFPLRHVLRPGARRDLRAIFGFALPLWLSGLMRQFRHNIQNVMLGVMATVSNVGIFAVAGRINTVSDVATNSVYVAARPAMAQLHDRKDRGPLQELYAATTRWTLTANIPFFLPMVLIPQSLLLIFGEQFTAGEEALVILACATMVNAATGTCQGMLDMTGHTGVKLVNTIVNTLLLVGVGIWAIPRWDVVGAAAASFVAVTIVNLGSLAEVWVLERLWPYDRTFIKPVVAGVLGLLGGLALRAWMPIERPLPALIQASVVVAGYVGLLLALGMEPQDRAIVDRGLLRIGQTARRGRAAVAARVGRSG
jgi:O-antigen/teichoic acid export membrane protein